ncbi:MAG: nicotinate-nucleotide adenylyltransferase [Planctomycetota bacterium]|jgi:nicotinate-nucleotide adenylyltransferase
MAKRIGIFGGSFDPVHLGHLIIAEQFRQAMQLDRVRFIPTKISPFKTDQVPTSDKQRLEMLRLAIGAHPQFEIDDREIRRGGISYTIDTLREMQSEDPQAEWYLLLGADSLVDFAKWKEPLDVLQQANVVVVRRGGIGGLDWSQLASIAPQEVIDQVRQRAIEFPAIEISSRDVRQRVRDGKSIRYLVPAAVEAYIREHHLWQSASAGESMKP